MESARTAVGTVVDALPDGFPAGLRVYGADQPKGCTDTRLVLPVQPLDRAGMKRAVGAVQPKGDTPIGLSLQKAARDLPKRANGVIGTRTILLICDGEDNCGGSGKTQPCEVTEQLAKDGVGLRMDTVGFQVRGNGTPAAGVHREAGNGRYCDAPDAKAPARQLQRSAQLSADGYKQGDSTARADSEASAGAGWSPAATAAAASDTMKLVAAAGIGAGTVLVLGLGVWTLLARRRPTAAPPDPVPFPAQGQAQGQVPGPVAGQEPGEVPGQGQGHGQAPGQYGPPPAW